MEICTYKVNQLLYSLTLLASLIMVGEVYQWSVGTAWLKVKVLESGCQLEEVGNSSADMQAVINEAALYISAQHEY